MLTPFNSPLRVQLANAEYLGSSAVKIGDKVYLVLDGMVLVPLDKPECADQRFTDAEVHAVGAVLERADGKYTALSFVSGRCAVADSVLYIGKEYKVYEPSDANRPGVLAVLSPLGLHEFRYDVFSYKRTSSYSVYLFKQEVEGSSGIVYAVGRRDKLGRRMEFPPIAFQEGPAYLVYVRGKRSQLSTLYLRGKPDWLYANVVTYVYTFSPYSAIVGLRKPPGSCAVLYQDGSGVMYKKCLWNTSLRADSPIIVGTESKLSLADLTADTLSMPTYVDCPEACVALPAIGGVTRPEPAWVVLKSARKDSRLYLVIEEYRMKDGSKLDEWEEKETSAGDPWKLIETALAQNLVFVRRYTYPKDAIALYSGFSMPVVLNAYEAEFVYKNDDCMRISYERIHPFDVVEGVCATNKGPMKLLFSRCYGGRYNYCGVKSVLPGGKCLKSNLYTISISRYADQPCSAYFSDDALLLAVKYNDYKTNEPMLALLVYTKKYKRLFRTNCIRDVIVTDAGLILRMRDNRLVPVTEHNAKNLAEVLSEVSERTGCKMDWWYIQSENCDVGAGSKKLIEERVECDNDCVNPFSF